jgi:predicted O-linked N-acetylglucosamine transferase (SPINDLY family)
VKPRTARNLRIGFVSAELGPHPVAVFLQPFLENIGHGRRHLTLFPTEGHSDSRSKLFRELAGTLPGSWRCATFLTSPSIPFPSTAVQRRLTRCGWACPRVALGGNHICGRMAVSIVRNHGRPEWAATSKDQYVSIVCTLARDAEGRKKLRNTLRVLMLASPLCDGGGLARALEDAFEVMYDHWELSVEIG